MSRGCGRTTDTSCPTTVTVCAAKTHAVIFPQKPNKAIY
uniref:Uncharacterized protein n=1 Tax=Anguilla anguilla TaxID=7936 RepID=A0A0E9QR21_ANGAN